MKTSLRKILHRHDLKDPRVIRPLAQLDELAQATQDMQDMKDCYDSLLSAAAATANSAYEFSESLQEMGSCLLEKTALNDDEDGGKVLLLLGKAQFELQKLVDSYRSHIFQTITIPSESLLNELRTLEEMKRQCDEKRDVYEHMISRHRERGRSRGGKGAGISLQQLETARDEYDDEATLFVFRLKSLKQGQSRSLLTQAARHYAAQLFFFKRALKSLETIEPHVKMVTEMQHIDYEFSGLEDDGDDNEDDDENDNGYDENDDGELSFDYGRDNQDQDVSTSQTTMEVDQVDHAMPEIPTVGAIKVNFDRLRRNSFSFRAKAGSQSAPLLADNMLDPKEKVRQLRPSLSRRFSSYVLPIPVDAKSSTLSRTGKTVLDRTRNVHHSSPLNLQNFNIIPGDEKLSGSNGKGALSVLKESNNNTSISVGLPPPLVDGLLLMRQDSVATSDFKKLKRQAFSGPLPRKPLPTKPVSGDQLFSGPLLRTPRSQPSSSSSPKVSPKVSPQVSPKVSPSVSPTIRSSLLKIHELHELPKPPAGTFPRALGLVGHSAPLVSRGQMFSGTMKSVTPKAASPLPPPPQMPRSFSIPSNSARVVALNVSTPPEAPHISAVTEEVSSPPLSPIAFPSNKQSFDGSEIIS